jgi:hypothetical protein
MGISGTVLVIFNNPTTRPRKFPSNRATSRTRGDYLLAVDRAGGVLFEVSPENPRVVENIDHFGGIHLMGISNANAELLIAS